MTFFRASFGIITRSNGGSAQRRSAYQRCTDEDQFKFSDKSDELHSAGLMLPEGAKTFDGPINLWREAEGMEKRIDAQLARTLEIAIPHEVPQDLRHQFTEHMLSWLVQDHGFAVEWSRHVAEHLFDDGTSRDTKNDHIHALVSLRSLGANGFNPLKDRNFNSLMRKRNGREMREFLADRMNQFFEQHGIRAKVTADPKATEALKIDVAPKHIIQAIKRTKKQGDNNGLVQPKSQRARDFIKARHSRKKAIQNAKEAAREYRHAERKLTTSGDTKKPDSTRNRQSDIREDRAKAGTELGKDRYGLHNAQRTADSSGPKSTSRKQAKRGNRGGSAAGPDRLGAKFERRDPDQQRLDQGSARPKPTAIGNLSECSRAIKIGKLRAATTANKPYLANLAESFSQNDKSSPPEVGSYLDGWNMDAASFLTAWAAQQYKNRYNG